MKQDACEKEHETVPGSQRVRESPTHRRHANVDRADEFEAAAPNEAFKARLAEMRAVERQIPGIPGLADQRCPDAVYVRYLDDNDAPRARHSRDAVEEAGSIVVMLEDMHRKDEVECLFELAKPVHRKVPAVGKIERRIRVEIAAGDRPDPENFIQASREESASAAEIEYPRGANAGVFQKRARLPTERDRFDPVGKAGGPRLKILTLPSLVKERDVGKRRSGDANAAMKATHHLDVADVTALVLERTKALVFATTLRAYGTHLP